MRPISTALGSIFLCAPLAGAQIVSTTATIELLPDLPGGKVVFFPYAISNDGNTLVGFSDIENFQYEATVWRRGLGTIGLGDIDGGDIKSAAWAVSADGSVVAGTGWNGKVSRGFRWTEQTGLVELPLMPEFDQTASSFVYDITADGQTIAGLCGIIGFGSNTYACRWAGDEAVGTVRYEGRGISADGTRMTGTGSKDGRSQAWVWNVADPDKTFLGEVPGAVNTYSQPWTISSDGSTIVGTFDAKGPGGQEVERTFRWRAGTGMVDLGELPGVTTWAANPYAVSADGSIVLGEVYCGDCPEVGMAYIWDEDHGMRDLNKVVAEDYGLDLGDTLLLFATAISDDSAWIAGEARTANGDYPAFLLHLTDVCPADCNTDGALDLFDFLCFTNRFNAGDLAADCDGNGVLDLFDFLCFTNAFNAGC